jgi:hypothetical protein
MVATDLHRSAIVCGRFRSADRAGGHDCLNNSNNTLNKKPQEMTHHASVRGVSDLYKSRWSPATIESVVEWTEAVLQGNCGPSLSVQLRMMVLDEDALFLPPYNQPVAQHHSRFTFHFNKPKAATLPSTHFACGHCGRSNHGTAVMVMITMIMMGGQWQEKPWSRK